MIYAFLHFDGVYECIWSYFWDERGLSIFKVDDILAISESELRGSDQIESDTR